MYLSLAQEHYLTLLVLKDKRNNNQNSRASLPDFMRDQYDVVMKNTPDDKGEDPFTWKGFDNNDWGLGDQEYKFSSPEDKQLFLESMINLMPFLDALNDSYVQNTDPSYLEKGIGLLDFNSVTGGLKSIFGILFTLRHPAALVFG